MGRGPGVGPAGLAKPLLSGDGERGGLHSGFLLQQEEVRVPSLPTQRGKADPCWAAPPQTEGKEQD